MKKLASVLITASFILAAIIIAIPVFATKIHLLSLEEIVKQSDYIVIGTFTDKESYNDEGTIFARFNLSVEKVIKGNPRVQELTVIIPDGETGGVIHLDERTVVPSIILDTKTLVFLTRYKESEDMFCLFSRLSTTMQFIFSKWQYLGEDGRERFIDDIVKAMVDNHIPVSLPLSEQLACSVFVVPKLITALVIELILVFGAIVLAVNRVRKYHHLPALISERGWNLLDWFWATTWTLSLAYAVYIAVIISYLWWIGLIAVIIFCGGTSYLLVKRLPKILHKNSDIYSLIF